MSDKYLTGTKGRWVKGAWKDRYSAKAQADSRYKLLKSLEDFISLHRHGVIAPDSLLLLSSAMALRAALLARPLDKPSRK